MPKKVTRARRKPAGRAARPGARRSSARRAITAQTTVWEVLEAAPYASEVLERYGLFFDPFTFITLRSPLGAAADYNALTREEKAAFLRDLRAAVKAGPPPGWNDGVVNL